VSVPIAGLALLLALAAPAAAVAQESPDVDALARRAFVLLNEARAEAGLPALQLDGALSLIAQRHSREQANRGRVSHHSAEFGLSTERRVRITYPDVPRLAENVGRNRTVERLHAGLLASEGHRRNRLDPLFTHVGMGIAWDGAYALYLTEVFVTAPEGGALGAPVAYYFEAAPGSYEQRDNPRVEEGGQTIIIGAPGPEDPEYWTDAGINAYRAGDLAGAERSFRKALELQADYHYASYNLARVLISRGAPDEAVPLLDELIANDPGDLDAIATRGTAALFREQYDEAAEYFRRVLRVRPQDANAWYNLGLSLEYLDRPVDAETAYREALSINPDLTAAQAGLARVRRR
jgi:tetratricopeptide (TPR) repeat protein